MKLKGSGNSQHESDWGIETLNHSCWSPKVGKHLCFLDSAFRIHSKVLKHQGQKGQASPASQGQISMGCPRARRRVAWLKKRLYWGIIGASAGYINRAGLRRALIIHEDLECDLYTLETEMFEKKYIYIYIYLMLNIYLVLAHWTYSYLTEDGQGVPEGGAHKLLLQPDNGN